MLSLPEKELSLWRSDAKEAAYPPLRESLSVDVAVVGGGIAGLTSAYLLKRSGLKVAVLEKGAVGCGTTGHTTGKVTSQHNLMYEDMKNRLGEQTARIYGQANQAALAGIEKIIRREKADCEWERQDNYVFTGDWRKVEKFKSEAATAEALGLPASFETATPLPFKVRAAVKFHGQARINAQKYLDSLAAAVDGGGSHVFEKSRVIGIRDGRPCRIRTARASVIAKDVIVATNVPTLPLMARGSYCAVEYPHRSYIVACRTDRTFDGMYISPDYYNYSILPVGSGEKMLVLVGGRNHIPGLGRARSRYHVLADYAAVKLDAEEVVYRWSARDYMAYDGVPLAGKLYPWSKHVYTATAFKKWGLTNATACAMILHDVITGKPGPEADIFNPHRPGLIKSFGLAAKQELGL